MNIKMVLTEKLKDELMFDIIDQDTNICVGYLFTVGNHIAYEIKENYRCQGIATESVRQITKKLNHPILEITKNNIASRRVAEKAGYTLVREEMSFGIYEPDRKKHNR